MRQFGRLGSGLAITVAVGFGAACEDSKAKTDTGSTSTSPSETVDGADGINENPWAAPTETNAFRVAFANRGRIQGQNTDENELWLMDPDGKNQFALTELAKLADLEEPLSCNYGCIVSPNLRWLAVVAAPPGPNGYTLKFGKFNSSLEVKIVKGVEFTNIVDYKFAGDRVFFTRKKGCTGSSCQFEFTVIELAENVNEQIPFLVFPPDNDLASSTYTGRFRVSEDGKLMVLLNTTIRSTHVYLWKDGTGLVELDFICKFGNIEHCEGTGSEYTDIDPVAIDPLGRYVVFFTFADRWKRIRVYDVANPGQAQSAIAASVDQGNYIERVCNAGQLAEWQWPKVVGNPVFTPDGEEILFLTKNDCAVNGVPVDKAQTNILRVKVATLLSGKTLEESDIFNVTKNPKGNVTANRLTNAFSVASDGATVIFTATPSYDQNGNLIADGSARQRNDNEVYRVRLDGTNIQQLTNDVSYSAESPLCVSPTNP